MECMELLNNDLNKPKMQSFEVRNFSSNQLKKSAPLTNPWLIIPRINVVIIFKSNTQYIMVVISNKMYPIIQKLWAFNVSWKWWSFSKIIILGLQVLTIFFIETKYMYLNNYCPATALHTNTSPISDISIYFLCKSCTAFENDILQKRYHYLRVLWLVKK